MAKQTQKQLIAQLQKKVANMDGWVNVVTNLNVMGKDKKMGASPNPIFLNQRQADDFYSADDIAGKLIDRVPEEMTREGFEVYADGFDGTTEAIQEYFERFELDAKIEKGLKWARLYGGAGLIIGANDGQDFDKPLKYDKIKSIDFFSVLDKYRLRPTTESDIDYDPTSPNFEKPKFYYIQGNATNNNIGTKKSGTKIHYSRVIRFEGVPVQNSQISTVGWWGDSILSRLYNTIRDYQAAFSTAGTIITDFSQLTFKLKNLSDMIASGDSNLVRERLALLSGLSSVINAIVCEEGEEIERKSTSLAGLPELLDRMSSRLVAATDAPHTLVLGDSAGGLGSTGESEKRDWYDYIKNQQESKYRPVLKQVLKAIFSSKDGPTKGTLPPKYAIEFCPLWLPTEKEQAELRKIQMETDAGYIDRGVVSADEIAVSRYAGKQYSTETKLMFDRTKDLGGDLNAPATTTPDPTDKQAA